MNGMGSLLAVHDHRILIVDILKGISRFKKGKKGRDAKEVSLKQCAGQMLTRVLSHKHTALLSQSLIMLYFNFRYHIASFTEILTS
jgi:hypothetical protein